MYQQHDDLPEKPPVPKYRSNMLLPFSYAYSLLGLFVYISTVLLPLYLLWLCFGILKSF